MGKKNETTKTFTILRRYVSEVAGKKLTDLDGEVGKKIGMSDKSVQTVCAGSRDFKWGEAKGVAKYFAELCVDKKAVNIEALRTMMSDFLLGYGTLDVDAEVNRKVVNDFLVSLLGVSLSNRDKEFEMNGEVKGYSNLPENRYNGDIIREYLVNEIEKMLKENKVAFLTGFTGNGKSFVASSIAKNLYANSESKLKYAIWIDCRSGGIQFNDFLTEILVAFQIQNAGNLSVKDKKDCVERYLMENKIILVIDGFENIRILQDKHAIFNFISTSMHRDSVVIITCSERLSCYRDIIEYPNRFSEIKVNNFTLKDWEVLLNIYSSSRSDIAEALAAAPELKTYIFDLCKGNPYLMIHVIASISEKLLKGIGFDKIKEDYDLLMIDKKSYDAILDKSVRDLPDNCKLLLVTLSLFVSPVSLSILSIVSGLDGADEAGNLIEGSGMDTTISSCHNLYLIDHYVSDSDGKIKFFLPDILRAIMSSVIKEKHNDYSGVINRWVTYYVEYSKNIGFCFDDFNRLSKLDNDINSREIDNIIHLLNYCESEQRWKDFYTVSENTKYFFYTRGISGEGKDSIHYRRALAAQNLGDYVSEFDCLVYHCNVACKSKSWKDITKCFDRIEELLRTVDDIPEMSVLKYQYVKALYAFSNREIEEALIVFEDYKKKVETIMSKYESEEKLDKMILHDYVASLRWYSECLYLVVRDENDSKLRNNTMDQVFEMLDETIRLANSLKFERAIVHSHLIRIKFYLHIVPNMANVGKLFKELEGYKITIENDAMYSREYRTLIKQYNGGG